MKLSEAKDKFIRSRKLQGYTEKTVLNYREVLDRFIKFTGDIDLSNLSLENIEAYQEYLVDTHHARATVANYLRHIKAFINYLIEYDLYADKTLTSRIKLPKPSKRVVDIFSAEDMQLIFESIDVFPEWIRFRNCLIVALMYDSGLRQAEVCNILYKDINIDSMIILVHGKGNKERFVPLGKMSLQFLQSYSSFCPFHNDYVFCNKVGTQLTTNAVKKFMNKLKHDTGLAKLSSHRLRHNFATNYCLDMLKKQGFVDIYKLSSLLGHEEVETTKIYLHVAEKLIAASGFDSHLDNILLGKI